MQASEGATCGTTLSRTDSLLLIVDVQEKLAPHVAAHEDLVERCSALIAAALAMGMPILATEHFPDRIGPLIASLRAGLPPEGIYRKTSFGAMAHPEFAQLLAATGRRQCVVAGMEAHVCVLQTVLGLRRAGYEVFLIADDAGSRTSRQEDRHYALARMRDAGAVLMGTETALFELTGRGDDQNFRDVLGLVKSLP